MINEESDESKDKKDSNTSEWISDFFNADYVGARKKLKAEMESKSGEELLKDEAWMAYIDFKEDEVNGLDKLINLASENIESREVLSTVSYILSWEKHYDQALDIANLALEKFGNDAELLVLKADHLSSINEKEKAISLLSDSTYATIPAVAIALSEIYEGDDLDQAIDVIHSSYSKYPGNKKVAYKYARLLQEKGCHKEALYLLNFLCVNDPKDITYLGYLSNTCLQLNLYDKAMINLKEANALAKEKQAWLLHNIGNLLNNKGFFSESEKWLRKGIEIDPSSEYAHDRLSKAIKSRNEQSDKYSALCKEGQSLIRGRNRFDDKPNKQSQSDA